MIPSPEAFTTRTFSFACQIVALYRTLNATPAFPYAISRQFLRSGTSIGANIEESKAASSRRDLAARFAIALREARETKYWLRLILATRLSNSPLIDTALRECDQLVAILTRSVQRLRAE
jgi:four helix bundle protein